MESARYLRAIRRRWHVIVACVVVALLGVWLTTPSRPTPRTTYEATSTLVVAPDLVNASGTGNDFNVSLATVYTAKGSLPEQFAHSIGWTGTVTSLMKKIDTTADASSGTVTITAKDKNPVFAAKLANTFSDQIQKYLRDSAARDSAAALEVVRTQLTKLSQDVASLNDSMKRNSDPLLRARLDAETTEYTQTYQRFIELTNAAPRSPLVILEPAEATPASSGGLAAPTSRPGRMGLAGLVALLLGVFIAVIAERMDTRIRSAEGLEEAFGGLPVLAEIPPLPRGRPGSIVSVDLPASRAAQAYRSLRSALLLRSEQGLAETPSTTSGAGSRASAAPDAAHTSPFRAEGPVLSEQAKQAATSRQPDSALFAGGDAVVLLPKGGSMQVTSPPVYTPSHQAGARMGLTSCRLTGIPSADADPSYLVGDNRAELVLEPGEHVRWVPRAALRNSERPQDRAIAVTSAVADGCTTVAVANLAACFAETGRSVLIVDTNVHVRPGIARVLGEPDAPGLTDLNNLSAAAVRAVVQPTKIPNVEVITGGSRPDRLASILPRMDAVVAVARELADIVLIATAPLLGMSDAADVLPHSDSVLVVTRARTVRFADAEQANAVLSRLGVPVVGACLVDSTDTSASGVELRSDRRVRSGLPLESAARTDMSATAATATTAPSSTPLLRTALDDGGYRGEGAIRPR